MPNKATTIEELVAGLKSGSMKPTKDCYIDENGEVHITGSLSTSPTLPLIAQNKV